MDTRGTDAGGAVGQSRPGRTGLAGAAVGAGLIVGGVGRNLPVELAFRLGSGGRSAHCKSQAAVDCAFESLPGVIGGLLEVLIVLAVLVALLTVVGTVLTGVGAVRLRKAARRSDPAARSIAPVAGPHLRRATPDRLGLALVFLGVTLLVPALWLGGSFLWSLIG